MRTTGGRTWAALAMLIATLVLASCSTTNDDSATATATAGGDESAGQAALEANASPAALAAGDGGAAKATGNANVVLPASVSQPRIVKTATLRVEVKDGSFRRVFSEVATIASGSGGFVASSTSAAGESDGPASGSLVVRIPAERFDEVRSRIAKLGDLKSEELRGDDVGAQITDIEARLRNLRAQEEAIRVLMERASNVPETLQVQSQLTELRGQIEQLDAQRLRLDDAVTFATLTVQLDEPGAAPRGERSQLAKAVSAAIDGAAAVLAAVIVAIGYALPLAALALVAFAVIRLATRPRRLLSAEDGT